MKEEAEDELARKARGEDGPVIGAGTRVLILASEVDECFCAGADLKERKEMSAKEYVVSTSYLSLQSYPLSSRPNHQDPQTADPLLLPPRRTNDFLSTLRATLTALSALPIPTISAVSSLALGGGLELALATTFRVFASTALVGLPETRLAIIPGAGGTYRLRRLIGETRALEMILTGRRVGGGEAGMMGLCERVVETGPAGFTGGKAWRREVREKVLEGAVGLGREICEGGPGAVGAAVRAVKGGTGEAEGREYAGVVGMGDRDEALRAFGEKRKAGFRGR